MISKEKINRFFFDKKGWIPITFILLFVLAVLCVPTLMAILISSFFAAYAIEPIVRFFSTKMKIPRTLLTIFSMLLVGLIVSVLLLAVLPEIYRLVSSNIDVGKIVNSIWNFMNEQAAKLDIDLSSFVSKDNLMDAAEAHAAPLSKLTSKTFVIVGRQTFSFFSFAVDFLIFLVVTFFISSRYDRISRSIFSLVPQHKQAAAKDWIGKFDNVLSGFIRGQLTVCLVLGTIYAVIFSLFGVEGGLSLGIMVGILCFVPCLGLLTAVLITLLLVLLTGGLVGMFKVAAVFVVVQICDTLFITPNIVGKRMGVSPIYVIIALFAGAEIGGFLGVLVAVPLFAMIKLVLGDIIERYKASDFYNEKPGSVDPAIPKEQEKSGC